MKHVARVAVIAAGVLGVAGAVVFAHDVRRFRAANDPISLHREITLILDALQLQPFNSDAVGPTPHSIKGGPTYFTGGGIAKELPAREREIVRNALRTQGWTILSDQAVEYFPGWEVIAAKQLFVMNVGIGEGIVGVYFPILDEGSYVVVAIAGRSATPGWSKLE